MAAPGWRVVLMRSVQDITAELAATGLTPAQFGLLMELTVSVAAEARPATDDAAQRRREKDREYQAEKRRQNRQISADSSDIDEPSLEVSPPPPLPNPNLKAPLVPQKSKRLADDFVMPQEWKDWAREKRGWSASDIETEAENFTDYWQARGSSATSRDWRKTWQTWVRNSKRSDGSHRNADPAKPFDRTEYDARLARIGQRESYGPAQPLAVSVEARMKLVAAKASSPTEGTA